VNKKFERQQSLYETARDQCAILFNEVQRLRAKLTEVHKIVPPPSPIPGADYTDAIKVKWFDDLRKVLYDAEKDAGAAAEAARRTVEVFPARGRDLDR
jgi:hypothetical protein